MRMSPISQETYTEHTIKDVVGERRITGIIYYSRYIRAAAFIAVALFLMYDCGVSHSLRMLSGENAGQVINANTN